VLSSAGGLKKVDEIEFYPTSTTTTTSETAAGGSVFSNLNGQLKFWRRELASALGVRNLWDLKRGGGGNIALY
jgi:hypothetical protein